MNDGFGPPLGVWSVQKYEHAIFALKKNLLWMLTIQILILWKRLKMHIEETYISQRSDPLPLTLSNFLEKDNLI